VVCAFAGGFALRIIDPPAEIDRLVSVRGNAFNETA
jgi:hypothetical protein